MVPSIEDHRESVLVFIFRKRPFLLLRSSPHAKYDSRKEDRFLTSRLFGKGN